MTTEGWEITCPPLSGFPPSLRHLVGIGRSFWHPLGFFSLHTSYLDAPMYSVFLRLWLAQAPCYLMWSLSLLLSCDRISIKLQLTGKSRLIIQFCYTQSKCSYRIKPALKISGWRTYEQCVSASFMPNKKSVSDLKAPVVPLPKTAWWGWWVKSIFGGT